MASACATLINRMPGWPSTRKQKTVEILLWNYHYVDFACNQCVDSLCVKSVFKSWVELSNASVAFNTSSISNRRAVPGMPMERRLPRI